MANEWLRYANQGAIRNQPLDPRLVSALGFLGPMGVTAEVFSGGQDAEGPNRTGSHRHDHGGSGDMRFYRDGRQLDWANADDRPVFEEIVRRGKASGITGFGAGPGYMGAGTMHVGFGTPSVWGAGGKSDNAPDWLRTAYSGASPAKPDVIAEVLAAGGNPVMDGPKGQETAPRPVMGSMFPSAMASAAPTATPSSAPIPEAVQQQAAGIQPDRNGLANIFGMMAMADNSPRFSPVQIQGPSPQQANALSSLIQALKQRIV